MTSCVAIAQLRAGRKIFMRQHLQELAMRNRRKANHCKALLTDKNMQMHLSMYMYDTSIV